MESCWQYETFWGRTPTEKEYICSFSERNNFSLKYLNLNITSTEVSNSRHLKAHNLCDKGVFSFIIFSQLWQPIELKFSQVCFLMHMLSQVRRLVFDNCNQRCPVPSICPVNWAIELTVAHSSSIYFISLFKSVWKCCSLLKINCSWRTILLFFKCCRDSTF